MSSDNASSSTVSWQTLFWTLVPLATNTMTQPSGRVLSLSNRYGTYLRSTPLIAFLDALAFLLRILLTPLLLPVSLHQSLEVTIRERYKDNEIANEGLLSLEKQTWLRWVFFVVGTLGPSIKLMAIQGVPWTKTWGAMFLFAFLVTEAAALFARKSAVPSVHSSLPGMRNSAAELRVAERFEAIEIFIFYAATAAHCTILAWIFLDIWTLRSSAYVAPRIGDAATKVALLCLFMVGNIALSISCVAFGSLCYIYWFARQDRTRKLATPLWIGLRVGFGCISLASMVPIYHLYPLVMDSGLFTVSVCCIPGFVWGVKRICRLIPGLGETLLVERGADFGAVDGSAVNALTLCIVNIVVCVLWYWLRYDPEGTVNPSWTGIFG